MQVRLPPAGVRLRDILNQPATSHRAAQAGSVVASSRPASTPAARLLDVGRQTQNRLNAVSQQIVNNLEQLENAVQQSQNQTQPSTARATSSANPSRS